MDPLTKIEIANDDAMRWDNFASLSFDGEDWVMAAQDGTVLGMADNLMDATKMIQSWNQ